VYGVATDLVSYIKILFHSFKIEIAYTKSRELLEIDPGTRNFGVWGYWKLKKGKMKIIDAGVINTPAHTP